MRAPAVLLVSMMLVLAASACAAGPDAAGAVARGFAADFSGRDLDAAAADTDDPDAARRGLGAAWDGLQAQSMSAEIGSVRTEGDTARAEYTYQWHLPDDRVWRYDGILTLVRTDGRWSVRWSSTSVHPRLGGDQSLHLRVTPAPRAPVIGHDGAPVFEPGYSFQVRLSASAAGSVLPATAASLERILGDVEPGLTAQGLAEQASSFDGDYAVTRLSSEQADGLRTPLQELQGVSLSKQPELLPADSAFANDVVSDLAEYVRDDLHGTPGWSVVAVDRDGASVGVLTHTDPSPAPAVRISIDTSVQTAAQKAVDTAGKQAVLVAMQPSTGQILAVAQNDAADAQGPIAVQGLYPPGSTFKMITAGAAIRSGSAMPQTMLACPSHVAIGTRTISNYADFALGTVPLRTAFAASCNTTFAKLAGRMHPDALTDAAKLYGVGVDYDVDGITTVTGTIPPAKDRIVRSEDGFGQGEDLVSPFGMALAAATVANGKTPIPQLLSGHPTDVDGARGEITPPMIDGLRSMMRQVVTSGTGSLIADQGEVYGKTGEAEFDGGSHAWFAGYRGDIAFSTLIVGGGGSDHAVAMTRRMFTAMPDGYMT